MKTDRVFKMSFASIYPLYIQKAEHKGRTKTEVNTILTWLTGFDEKALQAQIENQNSLEDFFAQATLHPNVTMIKGLICGYRVEEIEDTLMQKIRYMDKLIDELAKGKSMEKILRK